MGELYFDNLLKLGSVNLNSNIFAGDPCYYEKDSIDVLVELTIREGVYDVFIAKHQGKNASIIIKNADYNLCQSDFNVYECGNNIPVDSGQAGFFNKDTFNTDDIVKELPKIDWSDNHTEFYKAMGYITINSEDEAGIYKSGAVSSTYDGDGSYDLFTAEKDGDIVGLAISFYSGYEYCTACGERVHISDVDINGICSDCTLECEEELEAEDYDNE